MKRLILLALLLVAASVSLTASQGAFARSSGYNFIVDDDFGTKSACKGANEPTLQAAVAAAVDGNWIYVCPGTYTGGLTIDKALFISAAEHRPLKCYYPIGWTATNPKSYAVFNGGLDITANGVTIQNLTLQGGTNGVNVPSTVSNFTIHGAIIQNNSATGINLAGTNQNIDENCIRSNPNGILVNQGLTDSMIVHNKSYSNDLHGIFLDGTGGAISNITIGDDESLDDSQFIRLVETDNTNINGGKAGGGVADSDGALIDVAASNDSLRIVGMQFKKADSWSIDFDSQGGGSNTNAYVADNTIFKSGYDGISADDNSLDNSTIQNNKVTRGGNNGIGLETNNTGNVISNNYVKQNATFDCYDNTVGPQNTWTGNIGNTQNQPGLCS